MRKHGLCTFVFNDLGDHDASASRSTHSTVAAHQRYRLFIAAWLAGKISGKANRSNGLSSHVRRYLVEKFGEKCSQCNWHERNEYTGKIPLDVHHKDGNHDNSRPDNICLLCPNCHSLTSSYKGANKGKGRKHRSRRR